MVGKSDGSGLILLETGVGRLSVRSGGDGSQPTAEPGSALLLNDSVRRVVANRTWRRVARRCR